QAYQTVYAREARGEEIALGQRFLRSAATVTRPGPTPPAPVWRYGYGRWDEKNKQLRAFRPLPHFQEGNWQGGPGLPDPKQSWLLLNAEGGHPGDGLDQVVVRRWIAPAGGTVHIEGVLGHKLEEEDPEADGVRGQVVAGGKRVLLSVTAFKSEAKMVVAHY